MAKKEEILDAAKKAAEVIKEKVEAVAERAEVKEAVEAVAEAAKAETKVITPKDAKIPEWTAGA